ncbi:hypothetical protein C8J56DRAFT_927780 [Mycena floridula]|nr:hypothetical protein C8J56DRAFT_927780 [Mycena floridula]
MTISLGGLAMSIRNPFSELIGNVFPKSDIRSIFCLVVFTIVFLVLAYLTNPSETSFRAYLTEQSFRQHLSRIDDGIDDDQDSTEKSNLTKSSYRRDSVSPARHTLPFDNRSPFHFANRASVSLRTPKHVFHTFGIFTIAAMIPLAKADRLRNETDISMISDSWYFGAFGKWWRGGVLEAWYQDVIARSNDEESWSSGILGMKTLDRCTEYNALPGLPFSTKNLPPHSFSRGSPPRLRNRDKASQRSGNSNRSSTPPPLPKSASLPLHTPRSSPDRNTIISSPPPLPVQSLSVVDSTHLALPALSTASSTAALFDQSPRVVELLRQISLSKASVIDLRTQLTETEASASQSHSSLQGELDTLRERKRQEDATRTELKTRTKALDDSKRTAEGVRREAEKRLKAVETARDDAKQRMVYLDKEIIDLQTRLSTDEAIVRRMHNNISEAEQEMAATLDYKRREIKVADDVITALNIRTRELEEKLASEKERLRLVREQAEQRKQLFPSLPVVDASLPRSPILYGSPYENLHPMEESGAGEGTNVVRDSRSFESESGGIPLSPRPAKLSLGRLSNFANRTNELGALRPNGFLSVYDDGLAHHSTTFSPFSDTPVSPGIAISPTSTSLIPSGLISSLDPPADVVSRSFRSESDVFLDRDWQNHGNGDPIRVHRSPVTTSPALMYPGEAEHDPFEVRVLSPRERERYQVGSDSAMDIQRVSILQRKPSEPLASDIYQLDEGLSAQKSASKRWFPTAKEKPMKGLNPDAKVFNIVRKSINGSNGTTAVGSINSYDALNPTGMMPSTGAGNNPSFLRAFAPSPAEREALKRALGGSTNASLELLPSLSDVGSIPSSPSHVQAIAVPQDNGRMAAKAIPAWLQTLPRIRKPNFSPWDDEETATRNGER